VIVAHIGALPVEELLPAASAALVAVRGWLIMRRRRNG
jgi:hypothetical protein